MQEQGSRSIQAAPIGMGRPTSGLRSAALERSANRLAARRFTERRDAVLDDRGRMIKVMMQSVETMLLRLGIQAS
jgi:hypothetical protein